MLTVLSVAYPLGPVGPDAVGGAEQVLTQIDAALVSAGHQSIVVACEGSHVAGTLVSVPRVSGTLDEEEIAGARARHGRAIDAVLESRPVDFVHMHGIDFDHYLPRPGVPVLVTLHGPPEWYSHEALHTKRRQTWFNAVSARQHARLQPNDRLIPPIENGVPIEALEAHHAKRRFALMLSRIAPEKGVHVALDAAHQAGLSLLIAGELFPYREHTRYLAQDVKPRLDRMRRLIGPAGFERKRRLLNATRCLVIASLVPETSSLVAREAMAAGTPVVALRSGALVDAVEHGRTGFLVDNVGDMAEAMRHAGRIDPQECRAVARGRFSASRMTDSYLDVYPRLATCRPEARAVETPL